jgi:predicted transglutaminase-like cysteine proteinase
MSQSHTHTLRHQALTSLVLILALLIAAPSHGDPKALTTFDGALLSSIEKRYGRSARKRLESLSFLINSQLRNKSELEQIRGINDFFNKVPYASDPQHWHKEDYWATPIEKLSTNGGDCEDYAIGKYFALRALGIPEEKLRLTYVKAIKLKEYHMVLTYTPKPKDVPLVLDNLDHSIKKGTERKDLMPVYSFNGSGLWLAKARGIGKRLGASTERLSLWKDLLQRIEKN